MTINPRDYDLGELRDAIEGSADAGSDESSATQSDESEGGRETNRRRDRQRQPDDRGEPRSGGGDRRSEPDAGRERRHDGENRRDPVEEQPGSSSGTPEPQPESHARDRRPDHEPRGQPPDSGGRSPDRTERRETPRDTPHPQSDRSQEQSRGSRVDPSRERSTQDRRRESEPRGQQRRDAEPPSERRRESESTPERGQRREDGRREESDNEYGGFSFGPHDTNEEQRGQGGQGGQRKQRGQRGDNRERAESSDGATPTGSRRAGPGAGPDAKPTQAAGPGGDVGFGLGGRSAAGLGGLSGGVDRPSFGPAGQRGRESGPGFRSNSADRSTAFRELHALERAAPGGQVQKPYLSRMPAAYETQVSMMQWIESLIVTAGLDQTLDALTYYRSLGWITGEVERTLAEHARTIAESTASGSVDLTMEDHRESLMMIAQLAHSQQLQDRRQPRTRRRR